MEIGKKTNPLPIGSILALPETDNVVNRTNELWVKTGHTVLKEDGWDYGTITSNVDVFQEYDQLAAFASRLTGPEGFASDGTNIITSSYDNDRLVRFDMDGNFISNTTVNDVMGLAYYATNNSFFTIVHPGGSIVERNNDAGLTQASSFASGIATCTDLTVKDDRLYAIDYTNKNVIEYTISSKSNLGAAFSISECTAPNAIHWNGTHFLVGDKTGNKVYRYTDAGVLVDSFVVDSPVGLFTHGGYLWVQNRAASMVTRYNVTKAMGLEDPVILNGVTCHMKVANALDFVSVRGIGDVSSDIPVNSVIPIKGTSGDWVNENGSAFLRTGTTNNDPGSYPNATTETGAGESRGLKGMHFRLSYPGYPYSFVWDNATGGVYGAFDDNVVKIKSDGTRDSSFVLSETLTSSTYDRVLTTDGEFLYSIRGDQREVAKIAFDGTVISKQTITPTKLDASSTNPRDATWDGTYFWVASSNVLWKYTAEWVCLGYITIDGLTKGLHVQGDKLFTIDTSSGEIRSHPLQPFRDTPLNQTTFQYSVKNVSEWGHFHTNTMRGLGIDADGRLISFETISSTRDFLKFGSEVGTSVVGISAHRQVPDLGIDYYAKIK